MGFRDDHEAMRARLAAMDAELGAARAERDDLRGERERATVLAARVRVLELDNAELRGEVPKARRRVRVALAGGLAALMIATIASVAYGIEAYDAAARARVIEQHQRAAQAPPAPPLPRGARTARVVDAQGPDAPAVGTLCAVSMGAAPRSSNPMHTAGMRTGTVQCGEERLFHQLVRCAGSGPCTSTGDGDARAYVDAERAFVQHGPRDAWSIELRFDPSPTP